MRKRIAGLGVVVGLALAMLPLIGAATAAEVCPEDGKVESVIDGDLDNIVLDAGVVVCIKGSTVLVTVTADGETSLRDLLGIDKNVSHYTVIEQVTTTTTQPTTTTTTTEPPITPPTVPPVTTFLCVDGEVIEVNLGDEGYPGKTKGEAVEECETATTMPTTQPPTTAPPTTQPPATTPPALPFTGPSDWLIPAAWTALGMIVIGSGAAWFFRDRLS